MDTFDRDDRPEVEVATVTVVNEGGEWNWNARAHDWVSLLSDREVASVLYTASRALRVLAESFGPEPGDDDPAPVFKLVKDDMAPGASG